ncbi:hypothetical protein XNC3_2690001 [Xenorhabdus nematophila F1]|nr:hypothetical protein XNC3_2690001 [Xenorhabdus nematophila F1]
MEFYIPIIGLGVAVFSLIFLVLRTRIHVLLAMLIAAIIAGVSGGFYMNASRLQRLPLF